MGKKSAKKPPVVDNTGTKVSDDLRQAVKDLGGDEEDLRLLQGIDENDEYTADETAKSFDQVYYELKPYRSCS